MRIAILLISMGEFCMRVGCQYERVRYLGWYNFMWNDPYILSITLMSCVYLILVVLP